MKPNSSDPSKVDISVVVPLFEEEESLAELNRQITEALSSSYSFEIIFVDDGSNDASWQKIEELAGADEHVRGIRFLRNYGKSTALQAGFDACHGQYVATLDADLQDDPQEIPAMIKKLEEGYDLVSGWKKERNDPVSKTVPSRFFNSVTARLTKISLNDFNCGLKVYRREVTDHIRLYGERHRYIPLLAKWQGYDRIGEKPVNHRPRKHGSTKFGFSRFMHGFLDLITLLFVSKYRQRPMHFFGTIGFIFLFLGVITNGYLAVDKLVYGAALGDRPLLLFGVMLMVLGAQFFSIGFLGELFYKDRKPQNKPNIKTTL